ncbi:MAG: tyrosinase family protein [Chloroflexi bacterium]|nr:tyrosinase family protein [Chloroflexota bacterium]
MIVRKDQSELTPSEWDTLIAALNAIQDVGADSPNYSSLARIHTPRFHQRTAHRFPEFLPWHREYLWVFENRLRRENPDVTLPYWDWAKDRRIPTRLARASEWGVTRGMDANDEVGDYRSEVNEAIAQTTFREFHSSINDPHGGIHLDVGGTSGEMGSFMRAPEDVLFWLHHCFLDKLWADWQASSSNAKLDIPARLLPESLFTHTGNEVLDISQMDYSYQ